MSVRFQYSGDKDISAGRSSGASIFAPSSGGSGFPPAGTVLETQYSQVYPIAEGGASFADPYAVEIASQVCTVDRVADGSGGFYLDWDNVRDVEYRPYGLFARSVSDPAPVAPVTISGTTYYTADRLYVNIYHDGIGSYYAVDTDVLARTGTVLFDDYNHSSVLVDIYGSVMNNGKYVRYQVTGIGFYEQFSNQGSFYSYGTFTGVYDPSMGNPVNWDGNGGWYS